MNELYNDFYAFIKENNLIIMIVVSVIVAFIVEIVKWLAKSFWAGTKKLTTRRAKRRIERLVEFYQHELLQVKSVKNQDPKILFNIIHRLYITFANIIGIAIVLLFLDFLDSDLWFYSFLGAGCSLLTSDVLHIIYVLGLFEKSKKYGDYKRKTKLRIEKLQSKLVYDDA